MRKRFMALLLVAIIGVMVISGCSQMKSAGSTSGNSNQNEKIELKVWDTFTSDAQKGASAAVNKAFETKYPNIKVTQVSKELDALTQTLKAAFMSGNAPDVIYAESGIGDDGSYLKAGYLLNLTDAFKTYGWDTKLMGASKSVPTVGNITYAVGNEMETMGLYYNQTIFDKLNLKAPTTIEELANDFAVIKKAGYYPLANTLDTKWWNNMNFIGTILYSFMTKDEINA